MRKYYNLKIRSIENVRYGKEMKKMDLFTITLTTIVSPLSVWPLSFFYYNYCQILSFCMKQYHYQTINHCRRSSNSSSAINIFHCHLPVVAEVWFWLSILLYIALVLLPWFPSSSLSSIVIVVSLWSSFTTVNPHHYHESLF